MDTKRTSPHHKQLVIAHQCSADLGFDDYVMHVSKIDISIDPEPYTHTMP